MHLLVFALSAVNLACVPPAFHQSAELRYRVLVFISPPEGQHPSVTSGVVAITKLGVEKSFGVEVTDDPSVFTPRNLERFQVVVFLSTWSEVLNDAQQQAFEDYMSKGRGYVGIHSASDTEYKWEWYGRLVGARFKTHPQIQRAVIKVEDRKFPATRHLPERWARVDEWYDFDHNPRGSVHVLMSLDEASYEGGQMGGDHPIAWAHEYGGGRVFYTALGHVPETFQEPLFLEHLFGAVEWAAGRAKADVRVAR